MLSIYIVSLCLFRFVQKYSIKYCTRKIKRIIQLPKFNDNEILSKTTNSVSVKSGSNGFESNLVLFRLKRAYPFAS